MYQGDAPVEMCLKPTGTVSVPPGMEIGGCDTNKPRIVGVSLAWTHSCPWGKVDMAMRRIDSSTWETTSNTATYEEDGTRNRAGWKG